MAMRRIHRRQSTKNSIPVQMLTPRERHRIGQSKTLDIMDAVKGGWSTVQEARRISIIASMVPDEIIYQHFDCSVRSYETALMFIDVSGFTDLCEKYTKVGHGGPSKLTQVLNSYIGSMVQEILTHNGDVLKFSGDAFLSMWKKTPTLRMQDIVHAAIDCGLNIQKNFGTYRTDIGVILKVKIAISAGLSHFSIIGGDSISQTHYVIVGQPVWDVKMAEYTSTAGDVLTTASAWIYVNEAEYCTQPCGDGRHTKVLGVGAAWKRVEKLQYSLGLKEKTPPFSIDTPKYNDSITSEISYREYSLRPSVIAAMRSSWWLGLRAFMLTPVLRAVDNDEPMDFLTEVRRVVVVFLNIITKTVTESVLIDVVNNAYKCVCSLTSEAGGLVNKVSMFDKDMMFLVVFGLRGLKHEDEAQKALQCAFQMKENLKDENITTVSIAVTSGTTYCGVVGHLLRREYTVIGAAVNKAARLMMAYPNKVTCDKETFLRSKLDQEHFKILEMKPLKGIAKPGPVYEVNTSGIDMSSITPTQIYAINTIFDCRFPLPETFTYKGDILSEVGVKNIIQRICKSIIRKFCVLAVLEAQYIDKESWRILIYLLEAKIFFVLMTITEEEKMLPTASNCLANNMIVKIQISGVDRWYLAALTCQLLDVQAIPPDLQKLIECASNGMPGWIQNFVISLVQRGALSVVTVTRIEAFESGAVMPSPTLLQRVECDVNLHCDDLYTRQTSYKSVDSFISLSMVSKQNSAHAMQKTDTIQMAVLAESYNFDDIKVDMTMDAVILKMYDSLTPFEKMLLKCGSVLGEVFSRRMLLHLLQSDSPRKVAQAVAKLFMIRVLECEGGDFTRDTSLVLVHPAPAWSATEKPPYCACLGMKQPPHCRDLPMYAFCGYMKFRHSLFRTTTYELLTASQKHEMHARVLLYLERYTRRCLACGAGCFTKLLGLRCDDGLINESDDLKRIKQQICALSAETRVPGDQDPSSGLIRENNDFSSTNVPAEISSYELLHTKGNLANRILVRKSSRHSAVHIYQKEKWVRSFSSLELDNCECLTILLSVYCQIIDHCRGAGEFEKLYDAYLEYADISIINLNIPQAIRLLFEVENFIASQTVSEDNICKTWIKKFRLATIYSMRGVCMLESGDLNEARKQLFLAMKLYGDPFPISKHGVRMCNVKATFHQMMALHVAPNLFVGRNVGVIGYFYEDIAMTLHRLYRLFTECKEIENATLAAKCALNYALITNSNFRVLCVSYGNMITTYRLKQKFSKCLSLERRAMEICHRKRGQLDVTEIDAVCYMYTSIFLFYVEWGKKVESLKFGQSVMHMMSSLTDLNTRQMLVLWMLKLLIADLRIHDMVAIMRDFFYMTDHYDLSSETWYYFYAMLILLDTGYCVESYATCEKFYMKKGDAIFRSKTPEAAWNFIVSMWLVQVKAMGALSPLDPSSFSRPELAIVKHVALSLNVDFDKKVLNGVATLDIDVLEDIADVILDSSNLTIEAVELADGTKLQYKLDDAIQNYGSKLSISLPKRALSGDKLKIKIKYTTSPTASALQWLDPAQTSGQKHPYLFSQCQPIHARSILPCQDTPAVKFTYEAEVTAPEGFTVLMSALRGDTRDAKTSFRQPMPLPSYLLAIAVGVLESKTLGPRSRVWSEKAEIDRSAWEFADTEKYLQAAEKLCGPYEWTQYDLLVLPPSFPYGGMENPCLTFVTPTLLAGDKSQADVIVHEIMHSWTGNLVTNRNFEHFWLNEGFTVFLERKVGASLISDTAEAKRSRDFHSLLGLQELTETVKDELGPTNQLTRLVVNLDGVHPDDAFSTVPYEKGSLFLRYLENLVGGPEVFDDFLRSYLVKFSKKSLDTDQFKAYLLDYFKDSEQLKTVDWDSWLYKSGMPPVIPDYDTSMTKAITALVSKIKQGNITIGRDDVKSFTPHQMINLLQELIDSPPLPLDTLRTLGALYQVDSSKNSELKYRWLRLCVRSMDLTKLSEVFDFVNQQGRMKFVRPLYRDLYAWEEVRQQAIDNFLKNEPYMMHVSAYTLRKDLHLNE